MVDEPSCGPSAAVDVAPEASSRAASFAKASAWKNESAKVAGRGMGRPLPPFLTLVKPNSSTSPSSSLFRPKMDFSLTPPSPTALMPEPFFGHARAVCPVSFHSKHLR